MGEEMREADWTELGVRPESVARWESLGVDAFTAALAQADGYGPSSAHHRLAGLRAVAGSWRATGMAAADALKWHRAGFSGTEASRWADRGVALEDAALAAGHRMVG